MTTTWRLGRIAGVDVGVHWSWLLVVALITWSLAAGVFPDTNPELGDGTYVAMALVAVPLFFACLLAHELGHAIIARREGMDIDGITLWVFGGVARFSGRFPSARAELRIAIAGPLVSLVLGVVLLTFAILTPLTSAVDGVIHWLGYINLALLVFNLLPALPLDGGRVLRSTLWLRTGDFVAATRRAAAAGRAIGQALIVVGIVIAFAGGGIGGLWLALIGWFVVGAAGAEDAAVRHEVALAGRTVSDAMVHHPVTVPADLPLARLADVVIERRYTAYPVIDSGRTVGLISFRALGPEAGGTVGDAMVPIGRALVVRADTPLADVLGDLLAAPLRRALVETDGQMGLLSVTDAVRLVEVLEARPTTARAVGAPGR